MLLTPSDVPDIPAFSPTAVSISVDPLLLGEPYLAVAETKRREAVQIADAAAVAVMAALVATLTGALIMPGVHAWTPLQAPRMQETSSGSSSPSFFSTAAVAAAAG